MRDYSELERVVCAGVLSESFREQLLTDPYRALQVGYLGHSFRLSSEELAFIGSLHVRDFQEFASRVSNWLYNRSWNRHRDAL